MKKEVRNKKTQKVEKLTDGAKEEELRYIHDGCVPEDKISKDGTSIKLTLTELDNIIHAERIDALARAFVILCVLVFGAAFIGSLLLVIFGM